MSAAGEEVSFNRVGEIVGMIDKNQNGMIDFEEFIGCMALIKSGGGIGGQSAALKQFGKHFTTTPPLSLKTIVIFFFNLFLVASSVFVHYL